MQKRISMAKKNQSYNEADDFNFIIDKLEASNNTGWSDKIFEGLMRSIGEKKIVY
jgi:hypothetical protein